MKDASYTATSTVGDGWENLPLWNGNPASRHTVDDATWFALIWRVDRLHPFVITDLADAIGAPAHSELVRSVNDVRR